MRAELIDAAYRAAYTFGQSTLGLITVGNSLADLDAVAVLAIAGTATLVSVLQSLIRITGSRIGVDDA